MPEHPLDCEMGLAGVGRPEHGGDAGAGSPFLVERRRESHILQVFLCIADAFRHCERSEAIRKAVTPGWCVSTRPQMCKLHIGESLDSGFDASHPPEMTKYGLLRRCAPRNDGKTLNSFFWHHQRRFVSLCDAFE